MSVKNPRKLFIKPFDAELSVRAFIISILIKKVVINVGGGTRPLDSFLPAAIKQIKSAAAARARDAYAARGCRSRKRVICAKCKAKREDAN